MTKNNILFLLLCIAIASCKDKKAQQKDVVVVEVPSDFEMYKTSEMAALMRMMTEENNNLKNAILKGEKLGGFNQDYLKIHTAELTDASDYDEEYQVFAKHFIEMQQNVFKADKSTQKEVFNTAVNACITCHKSKCSGPIPRIKKLLIP